MPAPTFDLTVQGTAPNQYSTESLLEAAINAALTALWQDLNGSKADIANSGKVFPSRESAVTAGQEVLRPALSQIMTREGNYLVVRSASGTADDPLFEAYPQWGAVMRIPNDIRVAADIANGMTQARPIAMLSPGGTGAHYTATSNWPLTTGVSLISFAPP
ncbi:hypothetical protein, partial [Paracoccus yeei]